MTTIRMSSHFPSFRLTVAAQMADYQQRMAEQIRRERQKRGWRREDLAQKTGASYRQIERWETAKSRPQIANRIALAEAFDIELAELFPDMEAEEQALRDQLDRIEAKLDALLAEAKIDPAQFDAPAPDLVAEIETAAAGSIEALGGRAPAKPSDKTTPARKRRAS